ncbi:hypothetical protein [Bordetella bronchialis]|uniref:hypothetical protein n=1 Tax=Bordetella bronchialis TaxID=463025 RepID=UPI0009F6C175|nr:hypothetical protein [Bordetella bronchialis]
MQSLLPVGAAPAAPQQSAAPAAAAGGATASPAAASAFASAQSASVSLGDAEFARLTQTYDADGGLPSSVPVWERASDDSISGIMSANYDSTSLAGRFHGLGAALLDRLLFSGSDYSQSVILRSPGSSSDGGVSTLDQTRQTQLHTVADNQVTLDIKTASGTTVHLSLTSQGGGLGVQIQVSGGTLSDAERIAVGGLADAFQTAIDGLTGVPPQLALDGLTQFDPGVLSSVDLRSSFKLTDGSLQTLSFQADGQHRSVAYSGTAGTVNVDVDLSNPSLIGSASQQANALANYLRQFDDAQSRGRGDAALMAMFKDAFTALNSNYGVSSDTATGAMPLSDMDHAMLSGLADFSASVRAAGQSSPNPMRPEEQDSFSYQVSQQTEIQGRGAADRSIEQTQQSHLSASYHQALYPDTPLNLTSDKYSQNYYYYQIDDSASSVASIGYREGRLVKATLAQSANQSTHTRKYVVGELQEDLTAPSSVSRGWDLLNLLQANQPKEDGSSTRQDLARWHDILSTIGDMVSMKSNPVLLRSAQLSGAKALDGA